MENENERILTKRSDPTSVGEENEAFFIRVENKTFFIRVWKSLPRRRILKTLRGSLTGRAQRGQHLLAVGLGCYKWYHSQKPNDVPTRRLSPEGGWTRGGMPARTLGPKGGGLEVPHR